MERPARTPAALLAALVASDPGRPRITCYDDTDGPTRGERVELSARVLANWVAKAGNLARDELDVGPGTVVRLDLPPHWRTLYWALAVWSLGAVVDLPGPDDARTPSAAGLPDVLVTSDTGRDDARAPALVVVTLAALARSAPHPVPTGAVDEAREIATHGDVLDLWDTPAPEDPALRLDGNVIRYGDLVPAPGTAAEVAPRVHTSTRDTAAFLRLAVDAWAASGSVVLTRGEAPAAVLDSRLRAEGVTGPA